MDHLASVVLSLIDVVEAEVDLLKARFFEAYIRSLLLLFAAIAIFAGVVVITIQVFDALAQSLSAPWPMLMTAGLCFFYALVLVCLAHRMR